MKECDKYHGEWNAKEETCTYNDYISRVCYRVTVKSGRLVLDKPAFVIEWFFDLQNVGPLDAERGL